PLEIMPRYSTVPPVAGLHLSTIPVGFNAPFGFESRYSRDFKGAIYFTFRDKNLKYTGKGVRHIRNKESACLIISKIKYGAHM
ncbi:MAG: hypothetical protein Q7U55_04120, partial [Deltaproteobacteria bacterium]|nr:hypothetical protein [Deltaproteobacteria bacterium]